MQADKLDCNSLFKTYSYLKEILPTVNVLRQTYPVRETKHKQQNEQTKQSTACKKKNLAQVYHQLPGYLLSRG